ncbi:hypothetical protein HMPREF1092_00566 [Clostridium thermobutyricum]|uniref:Uncharacterized protein n=1 Tax=Clostridium thermobutyricum TaxID=29372 RepID=N9WKH7_9CLOT|nr:hypothetical protein HMPREF1092_00566 [Clostridium thermobutyricum]
MSLKLFVKYIELCRELNKEPSLKGAMAFKIAFK